jgi:hypothetical protein
MRHRSGTARGRWCTERTALVRALNRHLRVVVVVTVFAGIDAACRTRDERDETRRVAAVATDATSGSTSASTHADASGAGAKPICPATGTWQMCSVVERLERAGLAPRREEAAAREAPLSQVGVSFTLGRSELRVFLYSDRAARERDQARLDRTKYLSATEPLSMQAEPTLIASDNLLAILRSRSDHQRERVSDALTAGPPQAPGTKG